MATIGRYLSGGSVCFRVLFVAKDHTRKTIRLGPVTRKEASEAKRAIGRLAWAVLKRKTDGPPPPPDERTARWLGALCDEDHARVAKVGLARPRRTGPPKQAITLGAFLASYIEGRGDVKPATRKKYESTRRSLVDRFGADRRLVDFTPADADDWQRDFVKKHKAENTVRKHAAVAKLFFGAAVKKRLIASNPFAHLKATIVPNRERMYFVTREETQKVIDACPDAEWRLIVALARYAGLRCPSEHFELRWRDVDWERERIKIISPKTAHHTGGGSRVIPLFAELRPYLAEVFDLAMPGADYVLGDRYRKDLPSNVNLRSRLLDIIWSAGLKEWPKLYQNMRSSRETELVGTFPMHVVVQWLGNSERVAMRHYLQVTEEDFARAAADPRGTQFGTPTSGKVALGGQGCCPMAPAAEREIGGNLAGKNDLEAACIASDCQPGSPVQTPQWPRRDSNPHGRLSPQDFKS